VRWELDQIQAKFVDAAGKNATLAGITARLHAERKSAELLTFLRHRWPHTQIMAAVLDPLPDSITLTEWHMGQETIPGTAGPTVALGETKQVPTDKASRRASDLKRLLDESATRQHFIALTGRAIDAAALHEYLARLGTHPLFLRIDLQSIENMPTDKGSTAATGTIHFTARAILRPGHGQSVSEKPATPAAPAGQGPLATRGELP
jgi:hypothetical protein